MAISWSGQISRRCLFSNVVYAAGAGAVLGFTANQAVAAKLSQTAVRYQGSPKGGERCDNCALWQSPASCKSVEGPIAAQGWCNIYVANRVQRRS
jgi:hypothetical protein